MQYIYIRSFEQKGDNDSLSENYWHNSFLFEPYYLVLTELVVKLFRVSNMVLNDLLVTFTPTIVFKHSRKGKPFDNLYIYR